MKIGVLTFWDSQDNYGQLLQCFALQKYLIDAGHDVFLIRYKHDNDYDNIYVKSPLGKRIIRLFNPFFFARAILIRLHNLQKESENKVRLFDEFRIRFLKTSDVLYTSYGELRENPPEADVYIVGSDQVWNPNYTGGQDIKAYKKIVNSYFLNFGCENTKRISYAASWGVKSLDDEKKRLIMPLLQKFDYVSVREESGINLCQQCGYKNAKWVCDPTILLPANIYRDVYKASKIKKIEEPYILLYMLNNQFEFDVNKIYDFAKKKKLKVVYVTGNGVSDKRKKTFATIPEWLYLIDNATYVITNSFHCGVFSTIFNKQYGIIPLSGKDKEMNLRFESLFSLYGIDSRFILLNDFNVLEKKYDSNHIESNFLQELQEICDA